MKKFLIQTAGIVYIAFLVVAIGGVNADESTVAYQIARFVFSLN